MPFSARWRARQADSNDFLWQGISIGAAGTLLVLIGYGFSFVAGNYI